jgi:hypothetical protein
MAMAMAMADKQENEFWRELRHKGGCCCFGWAMYTPCAFYMGIWALYNPKLPIWPLIGLPDLDLAGDLGAQKEAHPAQNHFSSKHLCKHIDVSAWLRR